MTLLRGQLLTTGPLAIIAICYAVAAPSSSPGNRMDRFLAPRTSNRASESISQGCRTTASTLRRQLPADWNISIHEPYVVAGDCSLDQLTHYFHDTIAPTARALSIQYFDSEPLWPVTVLLCSSEENYRECHRCLGGRDRSEYAGIYSRSDHRLVVNTATGDGTLAHELTHALAHADFQELPEWLDEGLASLHEECEFSDDGLRLVGRENWRGQALWNAHQRRELRSVADMIGEKFGAEDPAVDYAQARYFCLFLQSRNLLEAYYRKCRNSTSRDGLSVLTDLLGTTDLKSIDTQFLTWMQGLRANRSR